MLEFVVAIADIVLGALAETKRINLYRLISSATRNFHLPRSPTVALLFSSLSSLIYSRSRSFCVAKMIHPSRQAYVEEAEVSKLPLLFELFKLSCHSQGFARTLRIGGFSMAHMLERVLGIKLTAVESLGH